MAGPMQAVNISQGSTVSHVICRICHEGDRLIPLISPCACSGSVGTIHQVCLEKWLSTVNKDDCELCGRKFLVHKNPKSITRWLLRSPFSDAHRNIIGDTICFFILTPMSLISAYLCVLGAVNHSDVVGGCASVVLLSLALFLVLVYTAWVIVTIRFQIKWILTWRKENQTVQLTQVDQADIV
ncbi:hypothetical protein TCAL_00377 [Tigriopus californicus]|uniref:RING-CH-type domain-containing protein n=1 Tax=Tigriopus californicus TaxID=6832 RepID=A0A553NCR9_TIGCA|nr:E3 ubiquitin-protein ligase MARCHF3-like [Tigriopus californicus]TRY63240.1 hypothetical protein TCAL_00377 [Tigriopus californicus]|eukprot:TCALIF_00377-PA protein Name:"Similar to march3 E3 ubiquitin-protein ligase MARCH3 (Xenopus laevis)" AED:0.04 eAED:0.04 QI:244/1/1/1/1/1/3/139/182